MENPQTKSKFEEKKFMTTGHFERAEMQAEHNMSNLEPSISTLRLKKKEPKFIIRHKKSSLGIRMISSSVQRKLDRITAEPTSTKDHSTVSPHASSKCTIEKQNQSRVLVIKMESQICSNLSNRQQACKLLPEPVADRIQKIICILPEKQRKVSLETRQKSEFRHIFRIA